jgi:hypothetical protein
MGRVGQGGPGDVQVRAGKMEDHSLRLWPVSSALSTVRETPFLLPGPGLFLEALEG